MPRPLRFQPEPWSVFFVTARCIHSRFLLRPSSKTNALVVGVMAKAIQRFDVKLFGMCFMSNHYHLLLSSKDAASLAQFMQYLNSNIARELGRLHNWREKFWSRRYRATAKKGATRIFIATHLVLRPIEFISTSIGGVYASSITIPTRALVCVLCHG